MTVFSQHRLGSYRIRSPLPSHPDISQNYRLKVREQDRIFLANSIRISLEKATFKLCGFKHHLISDPKNPNQLKPRLCPEIEKEQSMGCAHKYDKVHVASALYFLEQNGYLSADAIKILFTYERNSYDALRAGDYLATVLGAIAAGNERRKPLPENVLNSLVKEVNYTKDPKKLTTAQAKRIIHRVHSEILTERKKIWSCLMSCLLAVADKEKNLDSIILSHLKTEKNLFPISAVLV